MARADGTGAGANDAGIANDASAGKPKTMGGRYALIHPTHRRKSPCSEYPSECGERIRAGVRDG